MCYTADECMGKRSCNASGKCSGESQCPPAKIDLCGIDETKNKLGAYQCSQDNECQGSRYCSEYGWCQGDSECKGYDKVGGSCTYTE